MPTFSIKDLLIATTLVAFGLGMALSSLNMPRWAYSGIGEYVIAVLYYGSSEKRRSNCQ
jgi:hypothetical protein